MTRILLAATLLGTSLLPPLAARAQEAITLETIGAVRMAPPQEVLRMNAEAARRQQTVPVSLPRRQAAIVR